MLPTRSPLQLSAAATILDDGITSNAIRPLVAVQPLLEKEREKGSRSGPAGVRRGSRDGKSSRDFVLERELVYRVCWVWIAS